MSVSEKDDHLRQIIGAKRRNNIYGEISDYIIMTFLSLGGDGGIYSPNITTGRTIYGRSSAAMYIIRILTELPVDVQTTIPDLLTLSVACNATPVIAIPNDQVKRVKFYNIDGSRLRCFA